MNLIAQSIAFVAFLSCVISALEHENYESNITFYGFKDSVNERFISTFDKSIADQGCDVNGNFSLVVHGWFESVETDWVGKVVSRLLLHRRGCVFLMDYSRYSNVYFYFNLVQHFDGISAVLLKKFQQIGSFDRQYCFGFSFGARLCIDAGIEVGNQSISRMDVCDPAGWGFDSTVRARDPKLAAKNVACINTSTDKGTSVYNCHQNFRMGHCGWNQPAAGKRPMGSHGLCPYFYTDAFDLAFVPNNFFQCESKRTAPLAFQNVRMGYLGNFNTTFVRGDIFIATAKYPPYLVLNNVIDNKPN